MSRNVDNNPE